MIQLAAEIEDKQVKPTLLEQHEFAKIIPRHSEESYQSVLASIKEFGQRVKGLVYQGRVLDGNTRQKACIEAGIPFKYELFHGTDEEAKNEVIARIKHRHLTKAQISCCAAEWIERNKIKAGQCNSRYSEARKNGEVYKKLSPEEIRQNKTDYRAAQLFGVTVKSTAFALVLLRHAPKIFQKVKDGEMKITSAYNLYRQEAGSVVRTFQKNATIFRLEEFKRKVVIPDMFCSYEAIKPFIDHMCKLGWYGEMKFRWNEKLNCTQWFMNWYGNGHITQDRRLLLNHPEPTFIRAVIVAANDKAKDLNK